MKGINQILNLLSSVISFSPWFSFWLPVSDLWLFGRPAGSGLSGIWMFSTARFYERLAWFSVLVWSGCQDFPFVWSDMKQNAKRLPDSCLIGFLACLAALGDSSSCLALIMFINFEL